MSRLYDRIRRSTIATGGELGEKWVQNWGWTPRGKHPIKDATVVEVGNVAEYWFKHKPGLPDGAKISPPFNLAFYECKRPAWESVEKAFKEWGFLAIARDLFEDDVWEEYISWNGHKAFSPDDPEYGARWVVEYVLFANEERAGGLGGPLGIWYTFLSEDGQMIGDILCTPMLDAATDPNHPERYQEFYELGTALLGPILFAVSLTHCKNITLDENVPPTKLSKKHTRRYGNPLTKYYTLTIEAIARNSSAGQSAAREERSLHICRGHFATYAPEKPLFGKYSGTFWKPQHVKGNKKHGEVVKDYAVKAPHA